MRQKLFLAHTFERERWGGSWPGNNALRGGLQGGKAIYIALKNIFNSQGTQKASIGAEPRLCQPSAPSSARSIPGRPALLCFLRPLQACLRRTGKVGVAYWRSPPGGGRHRYLLVMRLLTRLTGRAPVAKWPSPPPVPSLPGSRPQPPRSRNLTRPPCAPPPPLLPPAPGFLKLLGEIRGPHGSCDSSQRRSPLSWAITSP